MEITEYFSRLNSFYDSINTVTSRMFRKRIENRWTMTYKDHFLYFDQIGLMDDRVEKILAISMLCDVLEDYSVPYKIFWLKPYGFEAQRAYTYLVSITVNDPLIHHLNQMTLLYQGLINYFYFSHHFHLLLQTIKRLVSLHREEGVNGWSQEILNPIIDRMENLETYFQPLSLSYAWMHNGHYPTSLESYLSELIDHEEFHDVANPIFPNSSRTTSPNNYMIINNDNTINTTSIKSATSSPSSPSISPSKSGTYSLLEHQESKALRDDILIKFLHVKNQSVKGLAAYHATIDPNTKLFTKKLFIIFTGQVDETIQFPWITSTSWFTRTISYPPEWPSIQCNQQYAQIHEIFHDQLIQFITEQKLAERIDDENTTTTNTMDSSFKMNSMDDMDENSSVFDLMSTTSSEYNIMTTNDVNSGKSINRNNNSSKKLLKRNGRPPRLNDQNFPTEIFYGHSTTDYTYGASSVSVFYLFVYYLFLLIE
jgi:hypothetical protein